ncbi:MAG: precorrin-2 C(20)-methyltransferase [Firmicutes bacterium]|nr:precorrin-2 C(20)-methyltransferase [Bacillota bacterium]
MKGKLFGVGVGPGDPELLSLKAVRVIRESDVIAVPGKTPAESYAYEIACKAMPDLESKPVIALKWTMTKDPEELKRVYRDAADLIGSNLEEGRSVSFLTIGDVSIYSTFIYVMKEVSEDGYEVEMVPGITSFSASASRLGVSLTEHQEMLHIVPVNYGEVKDLAGTMVLMKPGKDLESIKRSIKEAGRTAMMVEKCGLPDEKIYGSLEEIPDEGEYLSTVIVFDRKR